MTTAPLPTYLRTHRKRAGLSQEEVAMLIDATAGATVSRHETSSRLPHLAEAFAYEALFGIPASALFPKAYEEARAQIEEQAIRLLGKLVREGGDASASAQKRRFLEALIRRVRM